MESSSRTSMHEWLEKEAHNDLVLLQLLELREIMYNTDRALADYEDRHERMQIIQGAIQLRKETLGVDPSIEP